MSSSDSGFSFFTKGFLDSKKPPAPTKTTLLPVDPPSSKKKAAGIDVASSSKPSDLERLTRDAKYPALPADNSFALNALLKQAVDTFGDIEKYNIFDKTSAKKNPVYYRASNVKALHLDEHGVLRGQLGLTTYKNPVDCLDKKKGVPTSNKLSRYAGYCFEKALALMLGAAMEKINSLEKIISMDDEFVEQREKEPPKQSSSPSVPKEITPVEEAISRLERKFTSEIQNLQKTFAFMETRKNAFLSRSSPSQTPPQSAGSKNPSKKKKFMGKPKKFLHCVSITKLSCRELKGRSFVVKVDAADRFFDAKDHIRNLKKVVNHSIHVYPLPRKHRGNGYLVVTINTDNKSGSPQEADINRLDVLHDSVLGFVPGVSKVNLFMDNVDSGISISSADQLTPEESGHILYLYKKRDSFSGGKPVTSASATSLSPMDAGKSNSPSTPNLPDGSSTPSKSSTSSPVSPSSPVVESPLQSTPLPTHTSKKTRPNGTTPSGV